MTYRISFRPPAGVCVQQTQNAELIIVYEVGMIAPFRAALEKLRDDLLEQALQAARDKLAAEQQRQQLPQDRVTLLSAEITALESQRAPAV